MRDYVQADFENMKFAPHKKFWQVVAEQANDLKKKWEKENEHPKNETPQGA